jgi:transcriptional regulator with XRE-family HTH domain
MAKQGQEPTMVRDIKQAIQDSGLTLLELANRSGVHHSAIGRFLSGERTLTLPAAAKVCEALGLKLVRPKGQAPAPRHDADRPRRGRPRKKPMA